MTFHGRSPDDLPLAAYSTGMQPDERLEEEAEVEAAAPESSSAPGFAPATLGGAVGGLDLSTEPGAATATRRLAIPAVPAIPALPEWLAHPRAHLRDPRLLMTGVIGVGVVLLVASFVLGGGPSAGAAGPGSSASAAPAVVVTPAPPSGDATVEVTGKDLTGTYTLAGATGTGPASGGRIAATWADATGSGLALSGAASPGTRTTDATFTLNITVVVDGSPVAFASTEGECTVGMAVQPKSVTGSFVCKKLKSDDGKLTVDVRGTYRT